MREGLITRSLGGFYTVTFPDGSRLECRGRGVFRKERVTLLVGDRCRVEETEEGRGFITELLPRENFLARPPIANLNRLAIVVSLESPAPNALVLDELTAIAARRGIPVVFIFTKTDLASAEPWSTIYRQAGYPVALVSNVTGEGKEKAAALLQGGVTAFSGNSGAGKSSLLNLLYPDLALPTGEISEKLGRGRHTTRHVELYPDGRGGFLADTPGFSAIEFKRSERMTAAELAECFPEYREYIPRCRFTGCSHRNEQGCAVCEAIRAGKLSESRHKSYLAIYEELRDIKEWELK